MRRVVLAHETDFEGWRAAARRLAAAGERPGGVVWAVEGDGGDLLAETGELPPEPVAGAVTVPRGFLDMARNVAHHRDPQRWARLYALLVRLAAEPGLMERETDPDVTWARERDKAIRRDLHKMHAFVRFRKVGEAPGADGRPREAFVAWFEPEHRIVPLAAPFFVKRFASMDWAILTPEARAVWQDGTLALGPGARREEAPVDDAMEESWRTYYAAIFNPARLKVKAMTAEMPRKYWRNLPEARLIPSLVAGAQAAAEGHRTRTPTAPSVLSQRLAARRDAERQGERGDGMAETPNMFEDAEYPTLDAARAAAEHCERCPLWQPATQIVWGEGPRDARLMLVGEQPGDQEDLQGRPFVGPAGQLLDRALGDAGIDRAGVYITNAVKHFKYYPRGRRRMHDKPNGAEIQACKWWLSAERRLVAPRVLVAMGATAAQSVLNSRQSITRLREGEHPLEDGSLGLVTVHPSYLLRLPDPAAKEREYARFVQDLAAARERAAA